MSSLIGVKLGVFVVHKFRSDVLCMFVHVFIRVTLGKAATCMEKLSTCISEGPQCPQGLNECAILM